MADQTTRKTQKPDRQILGISLPPAMARAVKQEAARRGLSLKALFQEMWNLYKESRKDAR